MKKLLFITWSVSFGYGTEKSLADVLNRMDSAKYDISVLPLFKKSDHSIFKHNIRIMDSLIDYTSEEFDERKALDNYYALLADPLKFNKLIGEKYDCIIACNHNAPSYFASYIKCGAKILWIRGDMCELDYNKLKEETSEYKRVKQEYEMQANVLKCFDSIVVISDIVRKNLKDLFGITENVVKISNSVDCEKIKRLSRETIELPDKKMFTALGRLDHNKNHMLLVKAAYELKKVRDDFVIYLLGEGEERVRLEQYIREKGLQEQVKLPGFTENPYPYIKNSVATVLTSLSEGFSLVLVESVILNTPVISTDVGVAKELIERYACGDLIGYDEKELASILNNYLSDYDETPKKYAVENNFDIAVEAEKTADLIEQTINSHAALKKITKLKYPEITIYDHELDDYEINKNYMYILRVIKEGIPYEYLINRRKDSDKLIIFNNGAVAEGNVGVPVFQRHSWAKTLKTSSVFCMDPTLYLNSYLQVGWGIGKNSSYFLENSSLILKKIVRKMGIYPENTVIFGTSAGGFLSIIMGIYLKGAKVVADNAQLDIRKWIFKEALDAAITFSFDNISDALQYKERFSIVDAFEKNQYVPKIYLHVNLTSEADNSTQLVPFLEAAEKMKNILHYNDIEVILHFEPEKGHNGIGMNEAIEFLYKVLEEE